MKSLPRYVRSRLEAIDAWAVVPEEGEVRFSANLPGQTPGRGYRIGQENFAIYADNLLPLYGVFALGGPRSSIALQRPSRFPYHLFGPADDINHVGMAGYEPAKSIAGLEPGRELTTEALAAEKMLSERRDTCQPMPLFFARTESQAFERVVDLGEGLAVENLKTAVSNWISTAQVMGKPVALSGVLLDFGDEDATSTPQLFYEGLLGLMQQCEADVFSECSDPVRFFCFVDCGTQAEPRTNALQGYWKLAVDTGLSDLTLVAAGYMFERDAFGWFTDKGKHDRAAMLAKAMTHAPGTWRCPMGLHAEFEGDHILVTFDSIGDLVLDRSDPFEAGDLLGFQIFGARNHAAITDIRLSDDDPRAICLTCDRKPEGDDVWLAYAARGAADANRAYPANCGAVRDDWQSPNAEEAHLRRWALPFRLKVTGV